MGDRAKLLGFAVTVVFLALILSRIDLPRLGEALTSANYAFVAGAMCCTLASYVVRTYRWRRILAPTKVVSFRRLYPVLMIGFMANNVLPARLGEVVRAYLLGQREGVSKALGFATVMLERLLDGIVLLAFLVSLSFLMPIPGWGLGITYAGTAVFAAATLFVIVVLLWEGFARRLMDRALRPLPRGLGRQIADRASMFIVGLHALRDARAVLLLAIASVVIWSVEATFYFLNLRAFGMSDGGEGARMAVLLLVVVNLGIMIPSAPGYVGTFHALAVLALSAFSVDHTHAFSAAIVMHGVQYLLVTGTGLFFLGRGNLSFSQLRRQSIEEETGGRRFVDGSNGAGPPLDEGVLQREPRGVGVERRG